MKTLKNDVLVGDAKIILQDFELNSVDLVYLDPPFFTQKKQAQKTRDNSKEYSFEDSWGNIILYREYVKERLIECKRVMKNTASIFLHCDKQASHHLRIILDEVFGTENFQSEIIWSYKRWSNSKKGLLNSHQTILFYTKTSNYKFNTFYTDYSSTTNIDQIFQKRVRNEHGKTVYSQNEGGVEILTDKKGVPLGDVWEIPYLNPKAKERVGYPTQKPILLLEKIIRLVTDKGDLVLDPFCGSGTTLVASKLLQRNFIGIDISEDAVKLTKKRLLNPIKTESQLLKKGEDAYKNVDPEIKKYLSSFAVEPVQRNKGIDGFLKINGFMKPIAVKIQKSSETVDEAMNHLIQATEKNKFEKKVLVLTKQVEQQSFINTFEDHNIFIIEAYKQ